MEIEFRYVMASSQRARPSASFPYDVIQTSLKKIKRAVETVQVLRPKGERPDQLKSENLKVKDRLEDLSVGGRRILKLILKKLCVYVWTGYKWCIVGFSDRLF
jgi:hypothetical protein